MRCWGVDGLEPLGTTYTAVADLGTIFVVECDITFRPCIGVLECPISCFNWIVVARGVATVTAVGLKVRRWDGAGCKG